MHTPNVGFRGVLWRLARWWGLVLAFVGLVAIGGAVAAQVGVQADPVAVGLVTDEATLADMGWNWLAYQGLLRAEAELGVVGTVYTSTSGADYEPNPVSYTHLTLPTIYSV